MNNFIYVIEKKGFPRLINTSFISEIKSTDKSTTILIYVIGSNKCIIETVHTIDYFFNRLDVLQLKIKT